MGGVTPIHGTASDSHHCAHVTRQYHVVPVSGQWCSATGKVTVGLASHWPCITDCML